jgi:hypothetical protein
VILDELGVCRGQVRVDLAVVNGSLQGYEIKSDRDSLRRLGRQAEIYSRVFDRVTLVVGACHLSAALEIVPSWWGVLWVEPRQGARIRFRTRRRGRTNRGLDARCLAELLFLDDSLSMLAQRGAARGVRGKPRRVVWDRLCDHFSVGEIAGAVRAHLKARGAHPDRRSPS